MLDESLGQPVPHAFQYFHTQVRPARHYRADRQRQDAARDAADRTHADSALGKPAHRVDLFTCVIGFALQQRGVRQQRLPNDGELHPLGVPLEQGRPYLVFQPLDDAAQRRLRDVQDLCGTPEAAGRDDGGESAQLAQIERHAKR